MLCSKAAILALMVGTMAFKPNAVNQHNMKVLSQIDTAVFPEVESVFPVPTTTRCIVIMVCQYMIVFTALALFRTIFNCWYSKPAEQPLVQHKLRGLTAAAQTMQYAPMLCVLFIACRMRVEFLSNGRGQPQLWVQGCMYALTFAVLVNAIVVMIMPILSGKQVSLNDATRDIEEPQITPRVDPITKSKVVYYSMTALRYAILLGLYGGLTGIIVGINIYVPPGQTDLRNVPAPAPAILCTMILAVVFFLTQFIIVLCQTYTEFMGVDFYAGYIHKIKKVMHDAERTMDFAPMLAIVFLAARMRALQHDSQPQAWAQSCMYASTGALCLTTLLAIIIPDALEAGAMKKKPATNEDTFVVPSRFLGYVMVTIHFACMICFYIGVLGVIASILTFKAPGAHPTQHVFPTVQSVVNLTCQFFFVHAVLCCFLTISEASGGELKKHKFYSAFVAAQATLPWVPMLSILFVARLA